MDRIYSADQIIFWPVILYQLRIKQDTFWARNNRINRDNFWAQATCYIFATFQQKIMHTK